jgi:hypothetical protein
MATLLLRNQKGQPLTNAEVDGNFSALNTELIADTLAISNHNGKGGNVHLAATTSTAGFMSSADKTNLNSLVTAATNGATTTSSGPVLLATVAETKAGTSTTKATTPEGIAAAIADAVSGGAKTTSWTITEDATTKALYFKYNGVAKAKLDVNGNLVLSGTLTTGNGTIT